MVEIKKLDECDYSLARKDAMKEIEARKTNETLVEVVPQKREQKTRVTEKNNSYKIIIETLGDSKLSRKELLTKTGLTPGQIAGCIHRSKKTNGILKFTNGVFYVENIQ